MNMREDEGREEDKEGRKEDERWKEEKEGRLMNEER